MTNDQRQSVRMKTFLKGRIVFNNGATSMDCLVRDLSPSGARLEVSEATTLPEVFDLSIHNKHQTFRSMLRWRRMSSVGVTFDDVSAKLPAEPEAKKAVPEPAAADSSLSILIRRIAELEAENAALRSVIATLDKAATSNAA